jgi:hypothetical protein
VPYDGKKSTPILASDLRADVGIGPYDSQTGTHLQIGICLRLRRRGSGSGLPDPDCRNRIFSLFFQKA